MKFSVCTDAIFSGRETSEVLDEVKVLGYSAFEFWSWWDKDIEKIKNKKNELYLEVAAICTKFISLTDESKRNDYTNALKETIAVSKSLGNKVIISQVGDDTKRSKEEQMDSIISGLNSVKDLLIDTDMILTIEPLNTKIDHPGYFLNNTKDSFEILKKVNCKNIKVLYDIYHMQIMEGDLIRTISDNIDLIGHFHAAGNPGRHELSTGEITYKNVFDSIKNLGYKGFMGLEYFPVDKPKVGLENIIEKM